MMSKLVISDAEWEKAEQFFNNPLNQDKKLCRKDDPHYHKADTSIHSFIKVNDEIYALAANAYLGEGTFGKVKLGQNRNGDNVAVKIEGRGLRDESGNTVKIMRMVGYYIGQFLRSFNREILFKDEPTTQKLYTVTKLRKGRELYESLAFDHYAQTQKMIVAIKSCLAVEKLHKKRIVHADIKPENFMVTVNGHDIHIKTIDYDFSKIIPKGKPLFQDTEAMGTPEYVAPEIVYRYQYSFSSDIYALGMMFKNDLGFNFPICKKMTSHVPSQRPSMNEVIKDMKEHFEKEMGFDIDSMKVLQKVNRLLAPKRETALGQYYLANVAKQKSLLQYQHLASKEPIVIPVDDGKVQEIVNKFEKISMN